MICSSGSSGGAATSSTCTPATSGAASATASSTVCRTVEDEPAPVAARREPEPGHALIVDAEVLDRVRVRAEPRTHLLERAADPGVGVERVQVVDQQQALHQRVAGQRVEQSRPGVAIGPEDRDDRRQPGPVELDQAAHQFLGGVAGLRPGPRSQFGD